MKATIKWLKEYVDFDFSPEKTASIFTMAGIEVEKILYFAKGIENVIAGNILSFEKINSEKELFLCSVDIGTEALNIVTAASNIKKGMLVAVAPAGTLLPSGLKTESQSFRGIDSNGILCSEQDLGIADHSDKIIELPENSAIGKPIPELIDSEDTVLELSPTPNRPDCLNILGLAREISAITGNPLKLPRIKINESEYDNSKLVSIKIEEPELCPRYTARIIQKIKVSESPPFIRRRLKSVGIRSINNVVDITNYVLIELGHPLHAFDYNLIEGKKIVVRRARSGEKFKTLDGVERNLNDETLLIADSNRGIALAGIMGGQNSEVSENTTDILLESAYFNPVNIRRSSKYLGLSTEASYRFERSADPEILKFASDRAADLIQEICGGKIAAGIIDEYPKKIQREPFLFRHQKAEKILGIKIPENRVSDIIEKLGMEIQEKTDSAIKVVLPSYRPDLTREIDIIEEVARIFGYPNIPTTYPSPSLYHKRKIEKTSLVSEIRNLVTGWGFSEVINYSFIDERVLEKLGITDKSPLCNFVRLKNPLSEEQNILRTTLIPGLLANLELNTKRFLSDIKIFETGKVFFSKGSAEQPEEKTCFSGLLSGEYESKSWMNIKRRMDFFDAKGIIEAVSKHFSVTLSFRKHEDRYKFLDSGKSAEIFLNSKPLGFLGELHPEIAERFEILQSVAVFEICLDELLLNTGTNPVYKPIPKNPPTYRDISIILPEASGFNEIMDIIRKIGGEVLEDVKIFDLFKGKQVPAGKKSMTFSLVFRNPQRTLTDKEVDDIRLNIINELNKKLGAELRT